MKPILLATIDFPPMRGGVARYLGAMADFFGEEMIVVSDTDTLLSKKGFLRWKKAVRLFLQTGDSVRAIVVSHVLPLGTAALFAKRFTRVPYIVCVHGLDLSFAKRTRMKRWLAGMVLRHAALVVTNSRALGDEVKKDFGVKDTLTVYPPLAPPLIHEAAHHVRDTALSPVFLTVSRLVARKGHGRVLKALKRIQGKLPEGWHYRILGSGPEYTQIEEEIRTLGLGDHVSLEGEVDDATLIEAYKHASVFVMPTLAGGEDREGFGMVYVEAGAYGIPSIATEQPGVNEAVWQGESGLLVPEGDEEALESALLRLALDEKERKKLGDGARMRAKALLPEKVFSELHQFLNRL